MMINPKNTLLDHMLSNPDQMVVLESNKIGNLPPPFFYDDEERFSIYIIIF